MRTLILELDGLPSLREAMAASDIDLPAATTLAELAGVDAVRLGARPVEGNAALLGDGERSAARSASPLAFARDAQARVADGATRMRSTD